uniref:Uncharacterized protein LOC105135830 n=1 Tax=Rhizophora mucronata TaxID=61149 RepID=A0A2P2M412_RHIMU
MFASNGSQISFAKLSQGYRLSSSDGHYISTKTEGRKTIKLKVNEIVLQVNMLNFSAYYGEGERDYRIEAWAFIEFEYSIL